MVSHLSEWGWLACGFFEASQGIKNASSITLISDQNKVRDGNNAPD